MGLGIHSHQNPDIYVIWITKLHLSAVEVRKRSTWGWPPLTLIAGPIFLRAIGMLSWAGKSKEAQLADLHSWIEQDRQIGDVGEFEGHMP